MPAGDRVVLGEQHGQIVALPPGSPEQGELDTAGAVAFIADDDMMQWYTSVEPAYLTPE